MLSEFGAVLTPDCTRTSTVPLPAGATARDAAVIEHGDRRRRRVAEEDLQAAGGAGEVAAQSRSPTCRPGRGERSGR